jgi:hypothetical protein
MQLQKWLSEEDASVSDILMLATLTRTSVIASTMRQVIRAMRVLRFSTVLRLLVAYHHHRPTAAILAMVTIAQNVNATNMQTSVLLIRCNRFRCATAGTELQATIVKDVLVAFTEKQCNL